MRIIRIESTNRKEKGEILGRVCLSDNEKELEGQNHAVPLKRELRHLGKLFIQTIFRYGDQLCRRLVEKKNDMVLIKY